MAAARKFFQKMLEMFFEVVYNYYTVYIIWINFAKVRIVQRQITMNLKYHHFEIEGIIFRGSSFLNGCS